MAGRRNGELYNCRIEGEDLIIVADGHGLLPCTELRCDIVYHIPDPEMPDGIRTVVKSYPTGISLVTDPAESYSQADFEALLPFIKGEDGTDGKSAYETAVEAGYKGSEDEFAGSLSCLGDEPISCRVELVTDSATYILPIVCSEIPYAKESYIEYYYQSEGGIGIWDEI